jgi:hypothetical protein
MMKVNISTNQQNKQSPVNQRRTYNKMHNGGKTKKDTQNITEKSTNVEVCIRKPY